MATDETTNQEGQFHCVRCKSVFSAPLALGRPNLCSICGNSPQRDATYASVADITTAVDKDGNHGVPGKDIADFVSMKMVRRKKQVRLAVTCWVLLLMAVAGGAIYFQNTQSESVVEAGDEGEEVRKLREKTTDAYQESLRDYVSFISTEDPNQRSESVVKGVSKLLKLQYYYKTTTDVALSGGMKNLGVRYDADGEFPRMEVLALDSKQRPYELVFWNEGDGWKLDWEQHVRYQDVNWTEFLLDPRIGESYSFKLYVRRRYSSQKNGELNLIFYQPKILAGVRFQESPQVTVGANHPLYQELKQAFESLETQKEDGKKRVLGQLDSNGLLRVTAALSFVREGDEKPQLQLDAIEKFHWMEYDPVKAED